MSNLCMICVIAHDPNAVVPCASFRKLVYLEFSVCKSLWFVSFYMPIYLIHVEPLISEIWAYLRLQLLLVACYKSVWSLM